MAQTRMMTRQRQRYEGDGRKAVRKAAAVKAMKSLKATEQELGKIMMGDVIKNSAFDIRMLENVSCMFCAVWA